MICDHEEGLKELAEQKDSVQKGRLTRVNVSILKCVENRRGSMMRLDGRQHNVMLLIKY